MTQRRNWLRILFAFLMGWFAVLFCGLMLAMPVQLWLLPHLGASQALLAKSDWVLVVTVALMALLIAFGFARVEMLDQLDEYRRANGRCPNCGYNLRGIRRIAAHCPECGKTLKRRSPIDSP